MLRKTTLVTVYIFAFPAITLHRSFGDYTATYGYFFEVVAGIRFLISIGLHQPLHLYASL
uniref:Uncharacterized protein n=1 Tax=Helianthus annuus TaxID=4232 RepID=A0A251VC22_HELAN